MDGKKKVAFFGDFDYLFVSLREKGRVFDPQEVIKRVLGEGILIFAKMYADWIPKAAYKQTLRDLIVAGFELVECPTIDVGGGNTKSSTDDEMSTGIRRTLQHMEADVFIIGTGDRDFLRTMQDIKFVGKEVVLMCTSEGASADLKSVADRVIIVGDNGEATETVPQVSWPQEELEAHCKTVFAETTPDGIEAVSRNIPEKLSELIEGCLLKAIGQIEWGKEVGRRITLGHIRNVISTPRPPMTLEPWAEGVNPNNVFSVLVEMSKADVLHGETVDGPSGPITAYQVSRAHPFTKWVMGRHPELEPMDSEMVSKARERAQQFIKDEERRSVNDGILLADYVSGVVLDAPQPSHEGVPPTVTPDAPGRLAHEMDEGPEETAAEREIREARMRDVEDAQSVLDDFSEPEALTHSDEPDGGLTEYTEE